MDFDKDQTIDIIIKSHVRWLYNDTEDCITQIDTKNITIPYDGKKTKDEIIKDVQETLNKEIPTKTYAVCVARFHNVNLK